MSATQLPIPETTPVSQFHEGSPILNQDSSRSPKKSWPKKPKTPKPKPTNPIEDAIKLWFAALPPELTDNIQDILSLQNTAPKRWVVYPPMVLLPSGSFDGQEWTNPQLFPQNSLNVLWMKILELVGKREGKGVLTHLAINHGIPLHQESNVGEENLLRNPTSLKILHGDFGPAISPFVIPTPADFNEAFWVSTKQNSITQIWAPRYTMFSRGNVKEKARILNFHTTGPEERGRSKQELTETAAVDLYAGIGYFVFSYVKMGMGKVVGFELNPWSVEGLRRGANANGWSIQVVKSGEQWVPGDEKITVFEEDNATALKMLEMPTAVWLGSVTHVNCGLLPFSDGSWETALKLLTRDGWLHLHENVGFIDIEARKGAIEEAIRQIPSVRELNVKVEHVELVKTFAPGVWHCVFDVYITSR